jgi:hypothetical protein
MRTRFLLIALVATLPVAAFTQNRASDSAARPSDADILLAIGAVERADGYTDLLTATERYATAIGSSRTVELIDTRLREPGVEDNQRGLLMLLRQLSIDTRGRGAAAAVRLLSIRLIAGYALLVGSPKELADVLEKFSPLAKTITPQLVREALDTPGNGWPDGLLPLMQQLARDWPAAGALAAATRMASAASTPPSQSAPVPAPAPTPAGPPSLVGHWRSTTIVFDQPRDEHFVMRSDGTAETWVVTADSRTPVTRGRWRAQGTSLAVDWQDGRQWGQPFTFYQRQLVFPNIPNQRQFWELVAE